MKLFELAGAEDERRFSPYCWRTRMALTHKGLEAECVPVRFTEKETLGFSGQGKVPVLADGERAVSDSWDIACYLEETYPDSPSLFGGDMGKAQARFINNWADMVQIPGIARLIMTDVYDCLAEKDKDYFRTSREERFGMTLEAFSADRDKKLKQFGQSLNPLRATLKGQPYLCGTAPGYADYAVFGGFMWAKCTSPLKLLEEGDPVHAWRARLLDMHDGMAAKAFGYAA